MTGKSPLGYSKEPQQYEGLPMKIPVSGFQVILAKRAPTSNDTKYPITSLWVNQSSNTAYILTSQPGNWQVLESSGSGILPVSEGGTGQTTFPVHSILIGEGTAAFNNTGAGTSGQLLQSQGSSTDPAWTTATYPGTTTINQILYSNAANTVTGISTAVGGTILTNSSGVPSMVSLQPGRYLLGQPGGAQPAATFITNYYQTYAPSFNSLPIMNSSAGAAAAVTINTYNIWSFPAWGLYLEAYNNTTSTAVMPSLSATAGNGLNINTVLGATSKIIEFTEGNSVNSKNAFQPRTSAAFYVQASFSAATLSYITTMIVGFRKVQAYSATGLSSAAYTDFASIGVNGTAGLIETQTQIAGGGNTTTSTTQNITAATAVVFKVLVDANGNVTYTINGSSPTTYVAYQFGTSLTVIPWLYIGNSGAAGGPGEVDLISYQCGFQ
jgi:hypothetical protein